MAKGQTTTAEPADIITLASKTMAGDLRDFVLDRLKNDHNPLPWMMRPEDDQRSVIESTESAIRMWVSKACMLIAAGGQEAARGSLVKLVSKDGIQMQVNVAASDPLRHALMDHVGSSVLVILADAQPFQGERSAVKVMRDQKHLLDDDDEQAAAD